MRSSPGGMPPRAALALREYWGILRHDVWFWVPVGLLVLALLPYVVPVFDADQFWYWRWSYVDIPIGLAAALAVSFGVRGIRSKAERRFWRWIALALWTTLIVEFVQAFSTIEAWETAARLIPDVMYLVFYASLLFAVDASRGEVPDAGARSLQRLQKLGVGIVLVGFLTYFQGVPAASGPWWSGEGMLLIVGLDCLVLCGLLLARIGRKDLRWRRILLGWSVVMGLWLFVDVLETVLYLDRFIDSDPPPLGDLVWMTPAGATILVARRHLALPEEESVSLVREERWEHAQGFMVAGLLSLPLTHAVLHVAGVVDGALEETRTYVVYSFLAAMGAATLFYLRILESERTRVRKELEQTARHREKTLEELRIFLADTTHEIRTPIAVLLADIEVTRLTGGGGDEASLGAALDRVAAGLSDVVSRTHDLLAMAAGSVGVHRPVLEVIDVQALVDGVLESYRTPADHHKIRLDASVPAGLSVKGDFSLLGDALSNMVDNAFKHSPPGGRVAVEVVSDGAQTVFSVEDSGPGVPLPERKKIFERFYRGEWSSGVPGSGLGLAIVHSVADRHQGSVRCSTSRWGGARVSLSIPIGSGTRT